MHRKSIIPLLVCAAALVAPAALAQTPTPAEGGWGGAARHLDKQSLKARAHPAESEVEVSPPAAPSKAPDEHLGGFLDALHRSREARRLALVGTWRVNIPSSASGLPPFKALHTFNADGTFVETSDLLVTLTEGPAHGVWDYDGFRHHLTFELFVFGEDRKPAGMVRVRATLTLIGQNEFTAEYLVDFIDPDGNLALGIDSGGFSGKRLQVIPR